jgi:hypothetical protein
LQCRVDIYIRQYMHLCGHAIYDKKIIERWSRHIGIESSRLTSITGFESIIFFFDTPSRIPTFTFRHSKCSIFSCFYIFIFLHFSFDIFIFRPNWGKSLTI